MTPGDFQPMPPPITDPVARFWRLIQKSEDGCWIWTGNVSKAGYGNLWTPEKRGYVYAHRFSWRLANGEIPDGLCVLHKCDNPPCVNPSHLFLGTKRDNTHDMISKGRAKLHNPKRGEENGSAIINTEQAIQIKELLATGAFTLKEIASRTRSTTYIVFDIKRGKTWAHLKEPKNPGNTN